MTQEEIRMSESASRKKHWKRWGPYLSERAWGTVREDYSAYGNAWEYLPHDHARSRAYRWNEDGLAGISDRRQTICFALALWNERDPILKERIFGLTGNEGNHGEDVKEYYFYLDSTPSHSYMSYLYKYPQAAFPYAKLAEENRRRDRLQPEYELLDTGVFDTDRYFDVLVEYAKADSENRTRYVKDGINDYVVHGSTGAVNPAHAGTKAAAHYRFAIGAGKAVVIRLRLAECDFNGKSAFDDFDWIFGLRRLEADEFYATVIPQDLLPDEQNVMRQGFAGMLWSKQFYHYVIKDWLQGDPGNPAPPEERRKGRNHNWTHLHNADVISMPDKWEYPWYAAWDLAFHCIPLALVDSDFAKEQLTLMLREWYMHPNGQIPAYEWAFGDVNPPVHAWAAWRVYKIDKKRKGKGDRAFLQRVFHKLMLNFTWWVNRKDADGMNIFQGGFLGLDNIGVFDRSAPLPTGGYIEQSDGTSWMAMYTLNLLAIALEWAKEEPCYEDVASKFWEHFIYICRAMNDIGGEGIELWHGEDGFYYDVLHLPDGHALPLKVRSMVGLIPLFAVETLDPEVVDHLPGFKRRMQWFIENRPELSERFETEATEDGLRRFLSLVSRRH